MNPNELTNEFSSLVGWMTDASDYLVDATQRSILFTDILRKRGNVYLEHLKAGQPPVLVFPYEIIVDGRKLKCPVNYALVRIFDRRTHYQDIAADGTLRAKPWENPNRQPQVPPSSKRRPIVVIDPRAGHGPGIGGSKLDSQIGVAIDYGHPVYFILFFTDPEPGQTLAAVQEAEVMFLEEVAKRHPKADKPAVIGNCQAGWAAALIGADRPDVVGPMVFNGSPLSYWGGVNGANPMRYKGGLCGGVWLTSLFCDLGNGKFDGANLVAGFEDLNPANTLWTKQYNVYAGVDTEEKRFLDFEKWWGGFFKMNTEEIHFIVSSLFVGNELEQGFLKLGEKVIQLKNFKEPIVVFASSGDNITPPQQALNWIYKVYGTVDEIKRSGQIIVYIVHAKIGHLGIFVSSSVAQREHKQIIGNVEMIDYLSPGLYEMVIHNEPSKPWLNDHQVAFEAREMSDILALDDGLEDEDAFRPVAAISNFNDQIYRLFLHPWVKMMTTETSAEMIRQLHPLRRQRYMISDRNPFFLPLAPLADWVKTVRKPVAADNRFAKLEHLYSESVKIVLDCYRDVRDLGMEFVFQGLYDNIWMKALFHESKPVSAPKKIETRGKAMDDIEKELWIATMQKGGFVEAVVRIMVAVMGINRVLDKRQLEVAGQIIRVNDRLKKTRPADYKRMVKEQSAILEKDMDMAMKTIITLIPEKADREEAFEIANSVATVDMVLDDEEIRLLELIKNILKL